MNNSSGSIPGWRALAACRKEDPSLFFPNGTTGTWLQVIDEAKAVCRRCPVVGNCLQWALDTGEEHGVYGGLTETERRELSRRPARRISIDDYAGTPKTQHPGRSLDEAWETYTEPDGEHLLWTGGRTVYRPDGDVTPNRLAFYLDRGRWPEGDTKRSCGVRGCVRPAHLNDRRERAEKADLAVTA